MMDLVRSWLLGVTGVAILAAMADRMMPKGTIKGVGRLTGGLVLLVAMLTPVLSLDMDALFPEGGWQVAIDQTEEELEEERKKELATIIAGQLSAYIVDKAEERGISCTATVVCRYEGELCLPEQVTISGVTQSDQQEDLSLLVGEQLGISQTKIQFTEEGAG